MDKNIDSDPLETQEWREALDSVLAFEGPERAHFLLDELFTRRAARARRCPIPAPRPTSTRSRPTASRRHPGDRAIEHKIRSLHPLERAGHRAARQQGVAPSWAATSPASSRRRPSTTPASCTSGTRPPTSTAATWSTSRATRSPGIYARAFLEGRLTEEQLLNFRQEVDGDGPVLLPASLADAGLLAVPDRLDGPGAADGDLPGPLPQVPAPPRPGRHRQPQGLGLPGRRRDGRAGEPGRDLARRPREARQPGLRHQLQPAAPRRAGARQRQDHPGAGGRLPRRRLERHQGAVGLGLGPADRRRHRRQPAASAWRSASTASTRTSSPRTAPMSASTSSASTPSSRPWSPACPTSRSGPDPRRPRSQQGLRRLCRGGRTTRASRP